MPSLFSSRRRAGSANPPVDRNTSSAAAMAAGQAFLGRASSHANLSSAAAAAALRSQTTSPELVGNVQTKRTQRRASVSSTGSGSVIGSGTRGGVGRGGLQRTNSGGSMTERTFRSPSPGRQNSSGAQMPADEDAPPVPKLPNGHRRSASLDPPERMMSPTPGNGRRGQSVDRASLAPKTTKRPAKRLSNVNEEQSQYDEPPASPSSRNFSRPMSGSTSTAASNNKHTHGQGSWFTQASAAEGLNSGDRPRTSGGQSSTRAPGIEIPLGNPGHKKRISSAPGSHLSQANRNSIATSEPSRESDSIMVFDSNTRTFITKRRDQRDEPDSPVHSRTEQVYDPNSRSFISRAQADAEPELPPPAARPAAQPASRKTRPNVAALDTTLQPPPKNPARYSPASESPSSPRAMGFLNKQPSIVREEREAEEKAEASQPKAKQPMVATQQPTTMLAKTYATAGKTSHQRSSSLDVPRGEQAARGRNISISPSRSARFGASPVTDARLHNPLGRDASPVKSAMKHSPASSDRAASPLAGMSSTGPASESDAMSDVGSQDGLAPKRKKSARVSFDERAPEIAPSAPATAAPVEDVPSDDDGTMKPRPALPSFGSVRGQRMSPEPAEKVTEMAPDREGASYDTALGSILAGSLRGEGKKVERESSPQEPLPPEVTSRDMADYASDASSETDVQVHSVPSADATNPVTRDFAAETVPPPTHEVEQDDTHVPQISLQPPTPGLEEDIKRDLQDPSEPDEETKLKNRLSRDLSMPGGWGRDEEEETVQQPAQAPEAAVAQSKDSSSEDSAATQTVTPLRPTAPQQTPAQDLSDIYEDSDDSAEFSDAEEDLSYLGDGGFASLDAIVESPMASSTPLAKKNNLEDVAENESPSANRSVGDAKPRETDSGGSGDWGEATAYWSTLSKQQREKMEREHMSDADEEDDEPRPAPIRTKKKQPATGQAALKPALKQTPQQPAQSTSMRKSMRAQPGPAPAPAAEDGAVHMRRSMRSGGNGGGGGGMMSTMRDGPRQRPQSEHYPETKGSSQKRDAARPMSSGGIPASASGTTMRQSMRPGSSDSANRPRPNDSSYPPLPNNKRISQQAQPQQRTTERPATSARLQKELSKADDSDSESSFRKQRRRNRGDSISTMNSRAAEPAMRRSMRGGPSEAPSAAAPPPRPASPDVPRSSKWSMRSLSPTGSFFGRKQQPARVRASVDSGTRTTLRSQPPAARNAPAPTMRAKPTPAAAAPAPTSRFKSRFGADSDDEDDARAPKTFRSRFADSDDEDDPPAAAPANLTPVRGIPKRQGQEDGDSTDLDEEEDDDPRKKSRNRQKQSIPLVPDPSDVEKAMAQARRNLGMQEANGVAAETSQGNALQQGSLRKSPPATATNSAQASPQAAKAAEPVQPPQKRRGFMGSILRRNRNSTQSVQQVAPATATASGPTTPAATTVSPLAPNNKESPATPSSPSSPTAKKLSRRSSYQNPSSRPRRGDSDLSTATAPAMYSQSERDSGNWPLASPSAPPVPRIPEHLSNGATPVEGSGSPTSPSSPFYFKDAKEDQTLSPVSESKVSGRPSTSDGVSSTRGANGANTGNEIRLAKTMRPSAGQRAVSEQFSASSATRRKASGGHVAFLAGDEGSEPGERPQDVAQGAGAAPVYSRRTGKKKKFGMLRRAFGLDD